MHPWRNCSILDNPTASCHKKGGGPRENDCHIFAVTKRTANLFVAFSTVPRQRMRLFMGRDLIAWTAVIGPLTLCCVLLDPARSSAQSTRSYPTGLGFIHPLQTDIDSAQIPSRPTATYSRQQTHVFFVNGIDKLNLGGFYSLSEFVRTHGFPYTHFAQLAFGYQFYLKIKQIRRWDPAARIVLVGFSGGAYVVRRIANDLRCDGIDVDLLVYVGGDLIRNIPYSRPSNVRRILNITGHGFCLTGGNLFWNGANLDCAVNVRLPVYHLQLPSRCETIQLLMSELVAVTATGPAYP
jgi:hypothetical protein